MTFSVIREAAKNYFLNGSAIKRELPAIKREGGGWVKRLPLRKKITFLGTLLLLC